MSNSVVSINLCGDSVVITQKSRSFGNGMSFRLAELPLRDILKLLKEKIKQCILR